MEKQGGRATPHTSAQELRTHEKKGTTRVKSEQLEQRKSCMNSELEEEKGDTAHKSSGDICGRAPQTCSGHGGSPSGVPQNHGGAVQCTEEGNTNTALSWTEASQGGSRTHEAYCKTPVTESKTFRPHERVTETWGRHQWRSKQACCEAATPIRWVSDCRQSWRWGAHSVSEVHDLRTQSVDSCGRWSNGAQRSDDAILGEQPPEQSRQADKPTWGTRVGTWPKQLTVKVERWELTSSTEAGGYTGLTKHRSGA